FLADDERGAAACLIYDSTTIAPGLPAFNVATRGLVYFHVRVETGEGDLHSGLYGGAALNAVNTLTAMLASVLPRDGKLPEPLRVGVAPPTADELAGWARLPAGADELARAGGRPADGRAADEFYVRTYAEPSLDVNGIEGGSPHLIKTVVTGYALPDCNAHAPNERMALDHMALGLAAARETLTAWGDL